MNIKITSDRVTRATHLAWTRKFDEKLKQGWSDEDEDWRFESLCMFCVETVIFFSMFESSEYSIKYLFKYSNNIRSDYQRNAPATLAVLTLPLAGMTKMFSSSLFGYPKWGGLPVYNQGFACIRNRIFYQWRSWLTILLFLQNCGMGVDEFLHKATFRIIRATHLAWTRKFDENLKQGGVMRMRIEGLRASACFASRR